MKNKKVGIVIGTYNQTTLLNKCLKSIASTDYDNVMVVVVDDSGTNKIGKQIAIKFPWVKVIYNNKNLGCSKSFNIGANWLLNHYNPDYIAWLNDDIEIIEKDWLKKLISVGENHPTAGIIGCRLIYPDGTLQNVGGYMKGWKIESIPNDMSGIYEVDQFMGAVTLIRKDVIDKIGLMDEIFSPYLLEDTDYALRAKKVGFSIMVNADVTVIHNKGKTINSLEDDGKSMYIRFKNDIIFSRRHLDFGDGMFRIYIYLPLVAIFRKKNDESDLKIKNLRFRRKAIINLGYLFKAHIHSLFRS